MKLQKSTVIIFDTIYDRLSLFHELIQNNPAVIGYSGGKDSTLLAQFYNYLYSTNKSAEPILFHLDHSIRDNFLQEKEINLEMQKLSNQSFLKKKKIPAISKKIGKSLEVTGRLFRYKYLKQIAFKAKGYIATGHHSTDYLETVLIHLIRGGGFSSFSALPIYKNEIFRPLLKFTNQEIQQVLNTEKWKIFADESNEADLYLRNRIRKQVVPFLKKEGLNSDKLYDNFHNKDSYENEEIQKKSNIPSYSKIDTVSLLEISLGNLKLILDAYANILKIHPFTKNILLELNKELIKNTSFKIENSEIILWKNPSSDLFLIPKNSPSLREPKIIILNQKQFLKWNNKEVEISLELKVKFLEKSLTIKKNSIHRLVSELYRENQIPLPIRKFLPILFKENQAKLILFSLWDDKIRDFKGDLN